MRVLNLDENKYYDLEQLPEEIDELQYAILDNSQASNPDFFFVPLIFVESFSAPALVLQIGDKKIKMPVDWQVLIGEPEHGDIETVPLTSLNDRGFLAFQFNPLTSYSHEFLPIEVVDIYQDVTWYTPRLKNGHFVCVPIDDSVNPRCVYFAKEVSKNCEVIDFGKIF